MPVLAGALALAGAASAQTDNYPNKPIRLIAPFPPGGSVDVVGRIVGARLSQLLGQQVVIENRSGASGNIGMEAVARAVPDGYTIAINTLPLVTNGFLYSRVPYQRGERFRAGFALVVFGVGADGASLGAGALGARSHRSREGAAGHA